MFGGVQSAMPRRKPPQHEVEARRAEQRRKIGNLNTLRVAPKTKKRYEAAVAAFVAYVGMTIWSIHDMEELERWILVYIDVLWDRGKSIGAAQDLMSGVGYFLRKRKICLEAWHIIHVWRIHDFPNRVLPATAELSLALAGLALSQGRERLAAALVLTFHTFLRTGELLNCRKTHFSLNKQGKGVLVLPWTKGGQRKGEIENVTIDEAGIGGWLVRVLAGLHLGDPLLDLSRHQLGRWWQESLTAFGIDDVGFTFYSMRRGGASHFFRTTGNLPAALLRGRWEHTKTAKIYITEGMQVMVSLAFSSATSAALQQYIDYFYRVSASLNITF